MMVGVLKETMPGERRVALVPAVISSLIKAKLEVIVETGAGGHAGFHEEEYQSKGAKIASTPREVLRAANVLCCVRIDSTIEYSSEHTVIGLADPLGHPATAAKLASRGVRSFALELLPRITRAQSMDVLSSQATIAGHKAVLLAANHLPRLTMMMMTAAGTVRAAKAFVIGAGVAGLQAIASAKRLGAIVYAYDVRPAVKEQVESLGGRFVQMELESGEGAGGYAKAMDETFYARQRELMSRVVADSDMVITTAAVPGAQSPRLITAEMVHRMPRGAVIVDLAGKPGQTGGNCELTQPDEVIVTSDNHVTILGPSNLPATVPQTASDLYARNITNFLLHIVKDGQLKIDQADEITRGTLLTEQGHIMNERVRSKI